MKILGLAQNPTTYLGLPPQMKIPTCQIYIVGAKNRDGGEEMKVKLENRGHKVIELPI